MRTLPVIISFTLPFSAHIFKFYIDDASKVRDCIASSSDRIIVAQNSGPAQRIDDIINMKVEPYKVCLAGNESYGYVKFRYRINKIGSKPQELKVHIYSALGSSLEEHDERYKRIKSLKTAQYTK